MEIVLLVLLAGADESAWLDAQAKAEVAPVFEPDLAEATL